MTRETRESLLKKRKALRKEKIIILRANLSDIVHDIENPLQAILSGIEFLELKLPKADTEIKTSLRLIKKQVLKTHNTVRRLSRYYKP